VSWKRRITTPAHGDVERWAGPAGVGQARGESDLFDERFGIDDGFDAPGFLAAPVVIAAILDILGQLHFRTMMRAHSV